MSAHTGGEKLGPYRLHEQLGEGGMGVVYRATSPSGDAVAIKVLRQGVPAETTARRRLAREVETMRRVHSPFVAQVVDADVEGSPPYIVTRYVAGQTLDEHVASLGPVSGIALGRLACGLAQALVAVHAAGVVHRDLKPGNVMLVDGQPVVIDFGIAQTPDSTKLTMTGMFMGTPGYLAPEVIEGHPGGPAADVHSWGATMAYAATGRPPFGTGQFEAIFYRIVNGQPDLDTIPGPLLPLVLAALARDPARRPSAADLAELTTALTPDELTRAPSGTAAAAVAAAGLGPAGTIRAPGTAVLPAGEAQNGTVQPGVGQPGVGQPGVGQPGGVPAPAAAAGSALAGAAGAAGLAGLAGNGLAPSNGLAASNGLAGGAGLAPFTDSAAPTSYDLPPQPPVPGLAAPAWPGTMPLSSAGALAGSAPAAPPGRPQDFADLLPPVHYGRPAASNGAAPAGRAGAAPGQAARGQAAPGQTAPGQTAQGQPRKGLALATMAALVAISVLLPVGGAALALAVLIALRATDLTGRWLGKRRARQGQRGSDAVAMAAFYPVAVVRAALRCILLAPLAVLCAAAAAALSVLVSGPSALPRAASFAVGALIACYCLGPGSGACRRPLARFYGRLTTTRPAAVLGSVALVALAAAAIGTAASSAPAYWPATTLGNQLQTAATVHPALNHLTLNVSTIGSHVWRWLGERV